jgi:ABC-2 type transport system permease protein
MSNVESFSAFPIGVVDNDEYRAQTYFSEALASVSAAGSGNRLFEVTLMTREQADDSLSNNKISGYILVEDGIHVVVKSSGLNQTILKGFVDSYLQQASAVMSILNDNPAAARNLKLAGGGSYVKPAPLGGGSANVTVIMFYGLISMAVMFGGFWGRREVEDIQQISPYRRQGSTSRRSASLRPLSVPSARLCSFRLCRCWC